MSSTATLGLCAPGSVLSTNGLPPRDGGSAAVAIPAQARTRIVASIRAVPRMNPTLHSAPMSAQYIFTMHRLTKHYPPDKDVIKDITLAFMPGAKIGVLGYNGAGKSTVLRIMAGVDTEYRGDAQLAPGATVGLLEQEPQLDETKDVRGNVEDGVAETKALLARFNERAANSPEETADEFARLQSEIDAKNAWDLDSQLEHAMDALRLPPSDADVTKLSGGERRRVALCRLL